MSIKSIVNKILLIGLIIMAAMMLKDNTKRKKIHITLSRSLRQRAIKPYKHYQHADILNAAAQAANKYLHIDGDK